MSRDRKIIAGLIVAVIIELTLLLAHSGVIRFSSNDERGEGFRAGVIEQSHNHLRRRSLNSLVWENSSRNEVVNYYDSILTLKESTATLKLDNNTEVKLSENTLITINPPDEEHSGEIRLRFVRGNLQARNPFAKSAIAGEQWTVELKSGSEVELREIGDDGVEVQIKNGEALVAAGDGSQSLSPNEILRVNATGTTEKLNLHSSLSWKNPPNRRIYMHGEILPLALQWDGRATKLLIQSLGQTERIVELDEKTTQGIVDLPIGHHRLYLRDDKNSSTALNVEVWRAPLIHLIAPLPRNRVEIGDPVSFMWQRLPDVPKYAFRIEGTRKTEAASENSLIHQFNEEADVQWYIEGVDEEGYVIPPLYRYPLFVRSKPFAAPKLKMPTLRQPASPPPEKKKLDRGAWLWNWILPQAHAQSAQPKFEAVFSWEPVDKADQYVIEISETSDFRTPVVNTVVKTTEFSWRDFLFKNYYWRVAAGSSRGRMGMFSEPVPVDFSPLKSGRPIAALDGILIRTLQTSAPSTPPQKAEPTGAATIPFLSPVPTDHHKQSPVRRRIDLTQAQENWQPILLWQPNYSLMQVAGSEGAKAALNGGSPMAFGFEMPWRDYRNGLWVFDSAVTHYSFTPDPKERYPFQGDLKWMEFNLSATRYTSSFGMGINVRQLLRLQRKSYEEVTADTALWFGPQIAQHYPLSRGELNLRLSGLFGRDGQAVNFQPEWRARIGERFVTGVGIDGLWIMRSSSSGLVLHGFVTVGFPFDF